MISNRFSRLKVAAETIANKGSSAGLLPPYVFVDRSKDSADIDSIRTIPEFVARIPEAVKTRKVESIEPGAPNDPVSRLFRRSELSPEVWKRYSHFDPSKPYTRNLIATDHKTYTLLLMCWNPGQESRIHDHPCDGCWLQVLQGEVQEVRYDKQLQCTSDESYVAGQLSYITDNIGYHKVGNLTEQPAVSLHLYSPPFQWCRTWQSHQMDPLNPGVGCMNANYSEYGVKKIL